MIASVITHVMARAFVLPAFIVPALFIPAFAGPEATPAAEATRPAAAPTAQERFDALAGQIGSLRSDLEWIDRRERSLLQEMDRLEVERALRARELARLSTMKERSSRDLERTSSELQQRRAEAAREEAGLAVQLREAYKLGRMRELRVLLALARPGDLLEAVVYLDLLARRQGAKLDSVRRAQAETEALESTLKVQAESAASLLGQERQKLSELEKVRSRSADLLRATTLDRDAHRRAIGELTRAAESLEAAIVSGSADGQASPSIDVEKLRGALEWPVPGTVEIPFGDIKHPRFATITPHPGVDIRTDPGAPIRAVLAGRVVFGRRFSGYGNTVLLDHGGHYLSVYARAAVLSVAEGDEVVAGQVLGESADQAFDGGPPAVYFEFRRDGRAVDPAEWLKRRSGSRRQESHSS